MEALTARDNAAYTKRPPDSNHFESGGRYVRALVLS